MRTSDESRMDVVSTRSYTVLRFHRWPFPVNRIPLTTLTGTISRFLLHRMESCLESRIFQMWSVCDLNTGSTWRERTSAVFARTRISSKPFRMQGLKRLGDACSLPVPEDQFWPDGDAEALYKEEERSH